jgi:hypothetical protein
MAEAVKLLKEQPERRPGFIGRSRTRRAAASPCRFGQDVTPDGEPEITPEIDKYLAEQARDLVREGEGGSTQSRTSPKPSIEICCKRPGLGFKVRFLRACVVR